MAKHSSPFSVADREASILKYSRNRSRGGMKQLHQHTEYELAALISGSGWCSLECETIPMEGGYLYILPPDTPHLMSYSDLTTHVMYHIYFRPSLLEQLRLEFGVRLVEELNRCKAIPLTEELRRRLEQAQTSTNHSENPLDLDIRHLQIKCLLLTLAKQLQNDAPQSEVTHPHIHKTMRYIQEHLSEEMPLEQLAQRCGLSSSYLCRLFRQETGLTLTEYLLSVRIHSACRLLERTDLNISQVALQSGFNSTAYFDRRFRQMMGVSPSEYLNKHRPR